jgi:hypothetical protein
MKKDLNAKEEKAGQAQPWMQAVKIVNPLIIVEL